jgi:hypothetical protein
MDRWWEEIGGGDKKVLMTSNGTRGIFDISSVPLLFYAKNVYFKNVVFTSASRHHHTLLFPKYDSTIHFINKKIRHTSLVGNLECIIIEIKLV